MGFIGCLLDAAHDWAGLTPLYFERVLASHIGRIIPHLSEKVKDERCVL